MIDNISLLRPQIKFESDDDFYFMQVIRRGKDKGLTNANNKHIKSYYVKSLDHFDQSVEEAKILCDSLRARLYIYLNKRSFRKIALKNLALIAQDLESNNFECVKRSYDSCCGKFHNAKEKLWLLDIDSDTNTIKEQQDIMYCSPFEALFISIAKLCGHIMKDEHTYSCDLSQITVYPTQSGTHILCPPFNTYKARQEFNFDELSKSLNMSLFKDGQSLLYCNLK